MHRFVLLTTIISLALPINAADKPTVQVKELAEGVYELMVQLSNTTDPSDGQRALTPAAAKLCGSLPLQFGKYRFDAMEPMVNDGPAKNPKTSLTFVQQLRCGSTAIVDSPVTDASPAPSTPPTKTDEDTIRILTLAYLAAKDRGDFDSAHAMLAKNTAAMLSADTWRKPRSAFNAAADGEPKERKVVRVTWYDDPAGARPGRYAAADYGAAYSNGSFYCGFVAWLQQRDGSYQIVREEEGQLSEEAIRTLTPEQLAGARQQLQCRD